MTFHNMPNVQPQFIVIGAIKAATTWIQKQLQTHPGIFMPDVEPHYFSSEYHRGPTYYEGLFRLAPAGVVLGEKSADYLAHPLAAERIARAYPDVKLLVQLRNPVDRAYSDYKMLYRRGTVREGPEHYLKARNSSQPRLLAGGRYAEHLSRWMKLFPAANMLTFLFEDVRQRPQETLDLVCRHIGVQPQEIRAQARRENDSTEQFLPLSVRKALAPLKGAFAPLRGQRWFEATRGLMTRQVSYPPMSLALRAEIERYYADDIDKLEELLGRDLGQWRHRNLSSNAA
ncbi:hypothetical protein GGQ88_003861 [Novosphingobium hassiacum]|uniref:Sulfotransferase domain-containing protein n=1 Tax=Novosphingobium hassiacum TaxID=173676 RepID=A0A7W6A3F3_9SPHN|nr:sulfotransferase [Novosphingobium hassiacum]MBB3862560.1 hypothetical protein [Novosphingobium hassiacum]